ncbi:DUF3397 domain-containing protein [Cohnella pontilimi]|uniref:DUF3397 domain-containing protein n=1 Tax=Cohnella pontilimi TaxID=2564100 RepID=A0A4U0FEL3_9BACL|nr:DUF3397 domain-containing protein [Cohnella pontilimi]TJY43386.1 DUF3397 domain-containing protein [Cohnella pontilimi]
MSWLWNNIVYLYAGLATIPVVPFLVVYLLGRTRGMERNKSIRLSMDVTTAFLLGIVATLLKERFGSNLGFYFIVLIMLIGAGLIGNAQNRIRGKVDTARIIRAVWRLSFFAMSFMYLVLMSLRLIAPV